MAQYTYNKLVDSNIAPKEAKYIGIYDSNNERVGEIQLGPLSNERGTPLYKFGLLSDVHTDDSDYQYTQTGSYNYNGDEGAGDLRRALRYLRDVEHVDLFCCCGDMSQAGNDNEFQQSATEISNEIPNIPFYTCTGNHDVSGHTGASTFLNYFNNRTIDTSSYNLVFSTAYNNSFYFEKTVSGTNRKDVFVFFSQYYYSNSTYGQYYSSDLTWLNNVLSSHTSDRIFVFKHLFFLDYAGNLGRINGSGGIYPSNNILNGQSLTQLNNMLSQYPNVYWFSGHSHWKYYLQKYQRNANVGRYGSNGAWTIHVPSCSLPIDSDYSSTSGESGNNRVRKPLESQGAVVDVYSDGIVVRGIDFNTNSSLNGDTTRGYSGDTYIRYVTEATYDLKLN